MNTITLESVDNQISNTIAYFVSSYLIENYTRKQERIIQRKINSLEKEYKKLNKGLENIDLDGISSNEAKSKFEELEKLHKEFCSFIDSFMKRKNISEIHKKQLLPEMSKTLVHLEEILEALEIHADEEAMQALNDYLK